MSNMNYGPWFGSSPVQGQTPFRRLSWNAWNRTGGAFTQYGIYAFDLALQVTAESGANSYGITLPAVSNYKWADPKSADGQASAWMNVRPVPTTGTSLARLQSLVFCVAETAAADNELCEMRVIGEGPIFLIGTASQAYTGGWGVRVTPAQTYGTYREFTATAADANAASLYAANLSIRQVAVALVAKTEAGSPAATSVNSFFNGFGC